MSPEDSHTGSRTLIARGVRPAASIIKILPASETSPLEGHDHNISHDIIKCEWLLTLQDAIFPALAQRYPNRRDQESRFLELVLGPKQHQMVGSAYPNGSLTWRELWERFNYGGGSSICMDRNLVDGSLQLCKHVLERINGKCIFITSDGRVGLGPNGLSKTDVICVLFGCSMCIILRFLYPGHYLLVGPAYIDGAMSGEWVTRAKDEVFQIR